MMIKPNKRKIIRDLLIVAVVTVFVVFVGAGEPALEAVLLTVAFLVVLGLLYTFLMGVLPFIKIIERNKLEYRTDYGIKRVIDVDRVTKITIGYGFGKYHHALFIYHIDDQGMESRNRIKSSYYDQKDLVGFVNQIRIGKNIELNQEMEEFLGNE